MLHNTLAPKALNFVGFGKVMFDYINFPQCKVVVHPFPDEALGRSSTCCVQDAPPHRGPALGDSAWFGAARLHLSSSGASPYLGFILSRSPTASHLNERSRSALLRVLVKRSRATAGAFGEQTVSLNDDSLRHKIFRNVVM